MAKQEDEEHLFEQPSIHHTTCSNHQQITNNNIIWNVEQQSTGNCIIMMSIYISDTSNYRISAKIYFY
jgi:hypothetical protein